MTNQSIAAIPIVTISLILLAVFFFLARVQKAKDKEENSDKTNPVERNENLLIHIGGTIALVVGMAKYFYSHSLFLAGAAIFCLIASWAMGIMIVKCFYEFREKYRKDRQDGIRSITYSLIAMLTGTVLWFIKNPFTGIAAATFLIIVFALINRWPELMKENKQFPNQK